MPGRTQPLLPGRSPWPTTLLHTRRRCRRLCCCRSVLKKVKETFGVPIITDIHESWQAEPVAQVRASWRGCMAHRRPPVVHTLPPSSSPKMVAQYSTIQYSTVQYSTVQCSAVLPLCCPIPAPAFPYSQTRPQALTSRLAPGCPTLRPPPCRWPTSCRSLPSSAARPTCWWRPPRRARSSKSRRASSAPPRSCATRRKSAAMQVGAVWYRWYCKRYCGRDGGGPLHPKHWLCPHFTGGHHRCTLANILHPHTWLQATPTCWCASGAPSLATATCLTRLPPAARCRQPQRAGVRAGHHVWVQRPDCGPPQLCGHAGRGVPDNR